MKLTALLPMKGHSERVTNKNMRFFAGAPLFHRVASTLERSELIDSIVIDTDSKEIAEDAVGNFKKTKVIERPERLRGDMVSMNEIINYDIGLLSGEHFLQTHSTNPLLKTETIDRAIERYFEVLNEGYDSLFSVTRLQTRLYDSNGRAINHNPDKLIRTQDLLPVYEENSCLYIFSLKSFLKKKRRIGENPFMFEIPREEAWDIDEKIDFEIAEFLYKKLKTD
jgi:CMP-N-acetylneuraminic acid synthetase